MFISTLYIKPLSNRNNSLPGPGFKIGKLKRQCLLFCLLVESSPTQSLGRFSKIKRPFQSSNPEYDSALRSKSLPCRSHHHHFSEKENRSSLIEMIGPCFLLLVIELQALAFSRINPITDICSRALQKQSACFCDSAYIPPYRQNKNRAASRTRPFGNGQYPVQLTNQLPYRLFSNSILLIP
jgi:hypothetical protein